MVEEKLPFRISSALKDIIGKDLITNDYNAVFELIKNSYDANASNVDILFEHHDNKEPTLIIKDDGDGMDFEDIKNKWLFVAYSEKKYKGSTSKKRIQAGLKGIGRFSCDKLGDELTIYTKKKNEKMTHIVKIKWSDFEKNPEEEFSKIKVRYSSELISKIKTKSGTILEIAKTRENWGRDKYLKLRKDLERLINPNQKYGDGDKFSITLNVPSELLDDEEKKEYYAKKNIKEIYFQDIVNGKIENYLFENLNYKAISMHAKISDDGEYIETELRDKSTLIYSIKEKNIAFVYNKKKLGKINIYLFFLDKVTKTYLSKTMGTAARRRLGSVALYKNGFRIYPFGEEGDDSLGLDYRQTQKRSKLGTRDLMGRIEIGDNDDFQETSSRDGGLIKNDAQSTLEFFFNSILKKFEKYVVDIVKHQNFPEGENINFSEVNELKSKIVDLIISISKSKDIIDIKYDQEVVNILEQRSKESLQKIFSNFERIALENDNPDMLAEAQKASKTLNKINAIKNETEHALKKMEQIAIVEVNRAREAEESAEEYRKDSEEKTTRNIFLDSMLSKDLKSITSLHHHIGISAKNIENDTQLHLAMINEDNAKYNEGDFAKILGKISYEARKIKTISRFAIKTNFNLKGSEINLDISNFIKEYIDKVCYKSFQNKDKSKYINFKCEIESNSEFKINMAPIEIAMVVDNLIDNSIKAKADNIYVNILNYDEKFIEIKFWDDGIGIESGKENEIFKFGYTTTQGSGLGLYHVKEILKEIGGDIYLDSRGKQKAFFKMRIPK